MALALRSGRVGWPRRGDRRGLLRRGILAAWAVVLVQVAAGPIRAEGRGAPWARHTIDDSSRGADGVRLADVDGDGRLDVATGWEEGGTVRIYRNPGPRGAKRPWPAATVGRVGSPEDAVFVDLDGDGAADVVSCCEGGTRGLFVHRAPGDRDRSFDPAAWTTGAIPVAAGKQWMFCLPMQVDGRRGIDLVVGAKGAGAQVGWLESPPDPRDLAAWTWHPLCDAGWVMSLVAEDVDGDGDLDVVASDRKGPRRGCFWLENPGPGAEPATPWARHAIGGDDEEVMFLVVADLDRDGRRDVLAATRGRELLGFRRAAGGPVAWERFAVEMPPDTGTAKAVAVADLDLDGRLDLVVTCEDAVRKSGVVWLSYRRSVTDRAWDAHEISGPEGIKFDLVEPIDLDGDGDADVITCEERDNLGVIWYENPARMPAGRPGP